MDNLVKNFEYKEKPQVFEYYPQYYHKTDKDGRPVYIEHLGKIDITKIQQITSDERMLQNLVVEYEKVRPFGACSLMHRADSIERWQIHGFPPAAAKLAICSRPAARYWTRRESVSHLSPAFTATCRRHRQ